MPGTADNIPAGGKPENPEERRQYARSHVLWRADVVCPDDLVAGMVLNMSASGALVRVDRPVGEVEMKALRIPRFGDFPGKVVWQKRRTIGVEFLESPHNVARNIEDVLPECMATPADPHSQDS